MWLWWHAQAATQPSCLQLKQDVLLLCTCLINIVTIHLFGKKWFRYCAFQSLQSQLFTLHQIANPVCVLNVQFVQGLKESSLIQERVHNFRIYYVALTFVLSRCCFCRRLEDRSATSISHLKKENKCSLSRCVVCIVRSW